MPFSLLRILEERSGRRVAYRQFKLVKGRQVIEIVRGYGALGQAKDRKHHFAPRNARMVEALDQADERLGDAQRVGQIILAKPLGTAPFSKLHAAIPPGMRTRPPGPVTRRFHCKLQYCLARDNKITGAEYNELSLAVAFMEPGNRLRSLRKRAGLTQDQLAERAGVSQAAISQLESGARTLDLPWMRTFARVLRCAPADLLDEDDNPYLLDDHELALVERYRAADAAQRETLERVAAAVVPLPANDDERAVG